jgi:hypothetical protein
MSKHFKAILEGVSVILVLDSHTEYVRPSRKDFHNDAITLRKDAARVGRGMVAAVKKYGQIDNRKS